MLSKINTANGHNPDDLGENGCRCGRVVPTNVSLLVFLFTISLSPSLHLMPLLFYMTAWPTSIYAAKVNYIQAFWATLAGASDRMRTTLAIGRVKKGESSKILLN